MDDYKFNVTKLKKQELVDHHIRLMNSYDMLYNDNFNLKEEIDQQNFMISRLQKRIRQLESIIDNYEHINILFE